VGLAFEQLESQALAEALARARSGSACAATVDALLTVAAGVSVTTPVPALAAKPAVRLALVDAAVALKPDGSGTASPSSVTDARVSR